LEIRKFGFSNILNEIIPDTFFISITFFSRTIDRKQVFDQHKITINQLDTLNALSIGNGRFAMTMDITRL
jgi:hypothetical protein